MSLPGRDAFIATGADPADPDRENAWQNFGGKTIEEALELFSSVPYSYAEDFMWMDAEAFRFYFPVIDRYLRGLPPIHPDSFGTGAWIIAASIQMHFDCEEDMTGLHEPIIALCDYVCANLDCFDEERARQEEIRSAWSELRQRVLENHH
jgi:hypothetical protein